MVDSKDNPKKKRKPTHPSRMKAGAPPKYDLNQEAEELLEFALKEDSLNIIKFTVYKPYSYEQLLQWAREVPAFSQVYNKAKEIISVRREEHLHKNKFNSKVWERYIGIYDKHLRAHEEEDYKIKLAAESDSKKGEIQHVSEEMKILNQSVIEGISKLQEAKKKLD